MQNHRWLLFGGSIMLLAALFSLLFDSPYHLSAGSEVCNGTCSLTESTVYDFARGKFNYTGIRNVSDGEVQLLPIGLTSPWTLDGYALPGARSELAAVIYRNPTTYAETIYAIGGFGSDGLTPQSDIFTATTTATGAIAAPGWITATHSPLTITLAGTQAVISTTSTGGFLYVLGGIYSASQYKTSTILYKQININGALPSGPWSTAELPPTGAPVPLSSHQAFVRDGFLYIVAGADASGNLVSDIYHAQIQPDGSLGDWELESARTFARSAFAIARWNSENSGDWLYLIGGRSDKTHEYGEPDVDFTYFEGSGLHNPFTIATSGTVTALPVPRLGHTAVQAGGVMYVIGGDEGSSDASHSITNTVLTSLIDSTPGQVGYLVFPWITTNPLGEGRAYHASVISSIGEIYVIGGINNNNAPQATVYHGSTAGVGYNFAPAGNYTSPIIDRGNNRAISDIKVNAILTRTTGMTLTLQYRAGDNQSAVLAAQWKTLGDFLSDPSTTGVTRTFSLQSSDVYSSQLQYRAYFTTSYTNTSPILNAFQINYPAPPTPTPTATTTGTVQTPTPTVTPTGVISPDLTILGIAAPAGVGSASYQTMTIRVANLGNKAFSPPRLVPAPVPSQKPQPLTVRNKKLGQIAGPRRSMADPYFAWIELYIDRAIPSGVTDLGNCEDAAHNPVTPPYVYVGGLPIGTYKDYQISCWLTAGSHTFYSQVDTCDNPPTCSATYGYVLELNETNNIFGPVNSGSIITQTLGGNFLPIIQKHQ